MINRVASRRVSAAFGLLCSTAIAAVLASAPQAAHAQNADARATHTKSKAAKPTQVTKSSITATWTGPAPLPSDVVSHLRDARWKGLQPLVAGVFDKVREQPASRDAVLAYAGRLAPYLLRDLTTAADLAVITANDRLTLAPNASNVLGKFRATAVSAAPATAAASNVPMAVPQTQPTPANQTWNADLIKAQEAYNRNLTGAGVYVAVADSGFDVNNDALKNRFELAYAYNLVALPGQTVNVNDVGFQSANDSHGSHVAGIIAAEAINGVTMKGIAYDARLIPIRLLPDKIAGTKQVENADGMALDYFARLNGVKIYNASYGPEVDEFPARSLWSVPRDDAEYRGAMLALSRDKLIVAATGNDRTEHSAGKNPSGLALLPFVQPAHLESEVYTDGGEDLNYSALLKQPGMIIGVMSVMNNKQAAPYSNLCGVTASWCVAAPGGDASTVQVYSTVPDNTYGLASGTSMAAPAVSAALAILIQANPGYNARDLARLLFSTTEDLGAPGLDAVFGHGLIRLDRATAPVTAPTAGAAVNVAVNTTTYWAAETVTPGGFEKTGDGILTVSGRTYTQGSVFVTGGTLAVDGTLAVTGAGNELNVSTGALAGFGDVIGNTVISGILSPGKMPNAADNGNQTYMINSPGTISFHGNVTLTSTANFGVAIDGNYLTPGGPGTFSKVNVVGPGNTFIASGSLNPVLRDIAGGYNNYTPTLGTRFQIVTATEGASTAGSFNALTQPAELTAGTKFSVLYTPTTISLLVAPVSVQQFISSIPLSGNAQKIASIVEANTPGLGRTSPQVAQFFDTLYQADSAQSYAKAFEQLAGPGQAGSSVNAMDAMSAFGGTVGDRVGALESGADMAQSDLTPSTALAFGNDGKRLEVSAGNDAFASVRAPVQSTERWATWGRAFGRWSKTDDSNGASGGKANSGGLAFGMDRMLAPDLIGGVAAGYTRTNSSATDSSGRFDTYTGSLYATWSPNNWVVNGRASLGYTKISTIRQLVMTPTQITGDTSGIGVGFDTEVGYRFRTAHGTFKPFAGLGTQVFNRRGYSETLQPLGLTYPSQKFTKVTSTLGVAYSQQMMLGTANLLPELRVGWGHDWQDTTLTSQASLLDSPFTITAANPGREAALLGLSMTAWTRESTRFFVAYNGEYRARARSHQLSGGFRYAW